MAVKQSSNQLINQLTTLRAYEPFSCFKFCTFCLLNQCVKIKHHFFSFDGKGTILATLDLIGSSDQIGLSVDSNDFGVQLNQSDRTLRVASQLQVISTIGTNQITFKLNVRCSVLNSGLMVSLCSLDPLRPMLTTRQSYCVCMYVCVYSCMYLGVLFVCRRLRFNLFLWNKI